MHANKMKQIMKRVYQYVTISKCSRDACKCFDALKSKNTLLVSEFLGYRQCKDSRKIDDILLRQRQESVKKV